MVSRRYPAKSYDPDGAHIGPGPWLSVVHAINDLVPETFGAPTSTGKWWTGGWAEQYPTARIIHSEDGETVTIVALDEPTAAALLAVDRKDD